MENETPSKNKRANFVIPPSPCLKKLGYGTGVNVWQYQRKTNTSAALSPWAVKNVRSGLGSPYTSKYQSLIMKEADVLSDIKHDNIIQFKGMYKCKDGRQCLAMEKCGLSLGEFIEKRADNELGPFPVRDIITVALSISQALKYLHEEKKILHGDIKSYNILVKNDFEVVKLCDFGVCCKLENGAASEYVGTPVYSAPECQEWSQAPITSKADIFSLGLVIWEMIELRPPHTDDIDMDSTYNSECDDSVMILKDTRNMTGDESFMTDDSNNETMDAMMMKFGTRPAFSTTYSKDYQPIIEIFNSCTEQDATVRPSAARLMKMLQKLAK